MHKAPVTVQTKQRYWEFSCILCAFPHLMSLFSVLFAYHGHNCSCPLFVLNPCLTCNCYLIHPTRSRKEHHISKNRYPLISSLSRSFTVFRSKLEMFFVHKSSPAPRMYPEFKDFLR